MAGLSNYPPGVTGMEYQIAGASAETDEAVSCECGFSGEVVVSHYGTAWTWECPDCGAEVWGEEPDTEDYVVILED